MCASVYLAAMIDGRVLAWNAQKVLIADRTLPTMGIPFDFESSNSMSSISIQLLM
jgi:hypothetical protein